MQNNHLDFRLKLQSVIIIQNTCCQIQRISPHAPLAFRYVCVRKNSPVFKHSPASINGKQSVSGRAAKYGRFRRVSTKHLGIICHNSCSYTGHTDAVRLKQLWREGCVCLAVEFKYHRASSRITDCSFKELKGSVGLGS